MSDKPTFWCYVAADPNQPGAAWAICVDDPKFQKYTAESIAEWVKEGANIMRVTNDVGIEMINKWKRPEKTTPQQSLELAP